MEQVCKYSIIPIWANSDWLIENLVENMRQQDIDEMDKLGITDRYKEVKESVMASDEAFAAYDSTGKVIVIYGVIDKEPGGQIWCLGSNIFNDYKKSFVCCCMEILKRWRRRYKALWNFVSKENTLSIRWLRTYGAKFDKGYMVGSNEFWKFTIGGENNV